MPCKFGKGACRRRHCRFAHGPTSLKALLGELQAARSSLDIAVFTFTCNELADAVLAAVRRGVRVRLITDDDQMASRGSDVARLAKGGVAVRHDNSPALLHHKFGIVDGRTVLTGSFNWTRAAVLENRENILITAEPAALSSYTREFDKLWAEFSTRAHRVVGTTL